MGAIIPRKIFEGGSRDKTTRTHDDAVDAVESLRIEQDTLREGLELFVHNDKGIIVNGHVVTSGSSVPENRINIPWYGVVWLSGIRHTSTGSENTISIDNDDTKAESGFRNAIFFTATQTTGENALQIDGNRQLLGIAQAPVREGSIGKFLIHGVTQCKVKFTHSSPEESFIYATGANAGIEGVSEAVDHLVASEVGQAEIIWRDSVPSGTLEDEEYVIWCIIRLSGAPTSSIGDKSAVSQSDWDENGGNPKVEVKLSDDDGIVEDEAEAFDVFLPRNRDAENDYDPDVYEGDIIKWNTTFSGTVICTSTYLTSKIGDYRIQDATARIRTGWQLSNNAGAGVNAPDAPAAKDFQGRVLMGFDADNAAGDDSESSVGDRGGFREHGDGTNDHDNHEDTLIAGAIENHDVHTVDDVALALDAHDHTNNHVVGSGPNLDVVGGDEQIQPHDDHTHLGDPGNDLSHSEHVAKDGDNDIPHSESDNRMLFETVALIRRYK